jgi:hypothetical protein
MWLVLAFVVGFGLGVVAGVALSQRRRTPPAKAAPPEPWSLNDPFAAADGEMAAQTAFLRDLYQSYTNHPKKGN